MASLMLDRTRTLVAPRAGRFALVALLWLAVLGNQACASDTPAPEVDVSTTSRSIAVGDTFRLNLTVQWSEGTDVKPVAVPDKIGNFVVKDIANGPVSTSGGKRSRQSSLLLTAFDTGTQTVPPVTIVYTGSDGSSGKVDTRPVEIDVASVLPDNATDIKDIKHPIRVPRRWKDIVLSYLLILGLAAGAALSVLASFKRREELEGYLRRLWLKVGRPIWNLILRLLVLVGLVRRRETLAFDVAVDEPGLLPSEAALRELEKIRALGLIERGLVRELYTLASEVVRRYVERQSGVLAMESPTSYTLGALAGRGLSAQACGLVEEVLTECDLVKFAKYTPPLEKAASLVERSQAIVSLTAELSMVPDSWFLTQRYAGAKLRVTPRTGAGREHPPQTGGPVREEG